ncbi:hypothetical protein BH11GEM1_BH11GEM1_06750 [soil metagenome]
MRLIASSIGLTRSRSSFLPYVTGAELGIRVRWPTVHNEALLVIGARWVIIAALVEVTPLHAQ